MNREIYEKNLESLRSNFPGWAEKIETGAYERNNDVVVETEGSIVGSPIFCVSNYGKTLYLNGKYNPFYAGIDWLESVEPIEAFATVVILGIHDGIHIQNILLNTEKTTNVLIYEPSLDVFLKAIEEVDLSFLFDEERAIGIVVEGLNEDDKKALLDVMINYDNMTLLKVYISGNYEKLFRKEVADFVAKIRKRVDYVQIIWSTAIRFQDVSASNVFINCKYMYDGYSVLSLKDMLPPEIPTIIVSAGPSLNKNILDLKAAVGKANIIATDTALRPLLNAGIVPNFFVVIDAKKSIHRFEHGDISKVPMVTASGASVAPLQVHTGKKFFSYGGSGLEKKLMERAALADEETVWLADLPTGGSVANTAYSLGIMMGSKTIILIGQDLAMTGNKMHADGTFQDKMPEIDVKKDYFPEVESIDGGMVRTRADFKLYLEWFEQQIALRPKVQVIDATEGGAKIHGSEIMTLKEAIARECKKDFDIGEKLTQLPRMFGEVGKEEYLKAFEEVPQQLQKFYKKASEGIKYYEKLGKVAKKNHIDRKEIDKLLKKVGKVNEFMENDYMADIVMDSLRDLDSVLRVNIYRTKDDFKEELLDIADKGEVTLKKVKKVSQELTTLAEDVILPFVEEKKKERGY